jgi:hypothetical protein
MRPLYADRLQERGDFVGEHVLRIKSARIARLTAVAQIDRDTRESL